MIRKRTRIEAASACRTVEVAGARDAGTVCGDKGMFTCTSFAVIASVAAPADAFIRRVAKLRSKPVTSAAL